jgi:uncharacterized iron-regulated membrane protein
MTARRTSRGALLGALRNLVFWCHLVVAAAAGVVIIIMSATGVLLAYERQILAWSASRHHAVAPSTTAQRLPLDSAVARVRATLSHTPSLTVSSVTANANPGLPLTVGISDRRVLSVNPYTGEVLQGDAKLRAFFQGVQRWHRSVAIGVGVRSKTGTAITGASNVAFLFLVVSGFCLWWPRQWSARAFRAVGLLKLDARGRARDWNWHHVLGFWSAPVLLLLVSSAAFISYAWPLRTVTKLLGGAIAAADAGSPSERRAPARAAHGDSTTPAAASLDTLLARASAAGGRWRTIQLRLPSGATRTASAVVSEGNGARPDQRLQLTLDPVTGAITKREQYADLDPARRVRAWVRPVHTGEAGGLVGQTLAALASAAALVLGWTGFALAYRRLRARLARAGA